MSDDATKPIAGLIFAGAIPPDKPAQPIATFDPISASIQPAQRAAKPIS